MTRWSKGKYSSGGFTTGADLDPLTQGVPEHPGVEYQVAWAVLTAREVRKVSEPGWRIAYIPTPEPYAFYAKPDPVRGALPEQLEVTTVDYVLCLPDEVWDAIECNAVSGVDQEEGIVLLWTEGTPPGTTDVIVPLHPAQCKGRA